MTSPGSGSLYDRIGIGYDTTRRPDPYIVGRLAWHLELAPGGRYLDIACGTGNYTCALAAKGGSWNGLDTSGGMVRSAQEKNRGIPWFLGDVASLPFRDRTFAGGMCTLAIHHFPALLSVFQEMHRVLGRGRFVIFTATREQMRGYWLNEYFAEAMARSVEQMPSLDLVLESLTEAGFQVAYTEPYGIQLGLRDFFRYSGKHNPEMYLSPAVRQGISTFASLADPGEVAAGCVRLRSDIASGRIDEVREGYRHSGGDYLFVVAAKSI